MISKILSLLKKPKEKEKPHIAQERYDFLEDVCAEFLIQVNVEGDFVIGFNARESDMEAVQSIGNLIFLINSGTLSTFFIKSLELWIEEVEGKERDEREDFVALILSQWTGTQEEHQEMLDKIQESGQKNASQSAVDPSRVFNLRKYL